MPIYEFRCLKCNEIFELLFMSDQDSKEMKCPHCQSEEFERILSASNFSISGSSPRPQTNISTKACGDDSCGTIEIPGLGD